MSKRKRRVPIEVSRWLEFAARQSVLDGIASDPYSVAYLILAEYFDSLPSLDWTVAVLGLHIVYSWMPTIPRLGKIMRWSSEQKDALVAALDVVRKGEEPMTSQLKLIVSFCNNSIVGASKLMHFLCPLTSPIWDTRVARAFLKWPTISGSSVNRITRWKEYRSTILVWAQDRNVKRKCKEFRRTVMPLKQVSDVRLIELVLFHKTRSKRKDQLA
jgi:hypothetical protein